MFISAYGQMTYWSNVRDSFFCVRSKLVITECVIDRNVQQEKMVILKRHVNAFAYV